MVEPTVSVLTPSFQYRQFIGDALDSVSAQECVSLEHHVQDGNSSDGTVDLLRARSSLQWDSGKDLGQSDALNKAFSATTGKWVAWLNADEFYFPSAMARLVELGEASGADVVFGDTVFIDAGGAFIRLLPQHRFSRRTLSWYGPYISSCSTLFRRSCLGSTPWDTDLKRVMDWDLFLRLAEGGARFIHIATPVAAFRLHDNQVTREGRESFPEDYAKIRRRYGLPSDSKRRVGRGIHGLLKLWDGSYLRQWKAASLKGVDMKWFREEQGRTAFQKLMTTSYATSMSKP